MARERITAKLYDFDYVTERLGGNGRTLGSFLAETTNGIDLSLDCPDGNIRTISLAPFAGENPDHFLVFTFIESDIGFDHLDDDDRVVLGEYDFTPDREMPDFPPDDSLLLKKYELPPGARMIE